MTQKTGRLGASGREFCLCSLEKEDIEETLQLMDRCVGENLYQKEELEQAIGSSERAFLLLRTAEGELQKGRRKRSAWKICVLRVYWRR